MSTRRFAVIVTRPEGSQTFEFPTSCTAARTCANAVVYALGLQTGWYDNPRGAFDLIRKTRDGSSVRFVGDVL